jgi:hypothetical protein
MNERPKQANFREGFVDPKAQQPPAGMPPPELEPSPVEVEQEPAATAMEIAQDTWPVVVRLLYKPLVIPGGPTYTG